MRAMSLDTSNGMFERLVSTKDGLVWQTYPKGAFLTSTSRENDQQKIHLKYLLYNMLPYQTTRTRKQRYITTHLTTSMTHQSLPRTRNMLKYLFTWTPLVLRTILLFTLLEDSIINSLSRPPNHHCSMESPSHLLTATSPWLAIWETMTLPHHQLPHPRTHPPSQLPSH